MGVRISVFNRRAYREYTLTSYLNHEDKKLILDAAFYWIEEDIEIGFENSNGDWIIKQDEMYRLYDKETETLIEEDVLLGDKKKLSLETREGEKLTLFVTISEQILLPFKKFELSHNAYSFTIGNSGTSDLGYFAGESFGIDSDASLAKVTCRDQDVYVTPMGKTMVCINGSAIYKEEQLNPTDVLQIYGLSVCLVMHHKKLVFGVNTSYGDLSVNDAVLVPMSPVENASFLSAGSGPEVQLFRRSPRQVEAISEGEISIEEPPALDHSEQPGILWSIGNSLLMVLPMVTGCSMMLVASRMSGYNTSLFMYSGLVMAVTSAITGVVWGILNVRNQIKQKKDAEYRRFIAYGRYLIGKKQEIEDKYEGNISSMLKMYPEISELATYNRSNSQLWSRNESHADFLKVRIGIGDIPFQVKIEIPKDKFNLYSDELRDKPEYIKKNFETLYDVPQAISLRDNHVIGIVGGEEKYGAYEIVRSMVIRLSATHCYTDVKLVFIYDEDSVTAKREWDFVRYLPHTWSENRKIRYVASSPSEISDVCYSLVGIFRKRMEEKTENEGSKLHLPYYCIFLSDSSLLEGELLSGYIFGHASEVGVSTIILSERHEDLPNGCNLIVENTENYKGINNIFVGGEKKDLLFDSLNIDAAESFARDITSIRVKEMNVEGEIPDSITFLEMYKAFSVNDLGVEERWFKNKVFENIKGIIGVKGGDVPVYLDVHEKYHGPHGLVAGTTGSGKSETLQTYLLSLAVNYGPDDISFFIIDYKGGGMANLFEGLPHLSGSISNLSGAQINRAMVSIKSENMRRQRLFNNAGVNNINSYTKLYKSGEITEPLPHLFIIIDEFAELKREQPDFMRELISVAQVGRSLGVHLILSTQKPSGTVDDNIWSNSRFKLCLRVQTKEDSMEMLGKPDAAYITQAGRCYLEVGNDEIYELFQSGYTGAGYDPSAGRRTPSSIVNNTGRDEISLTLTEKKNKESKSQLDAVIEHIKNEAARLNYEAAHRLWMPILRNPMYLDEFEDYKKSAFDIVGRYQKSAFGENGDWQVSTIIGQTDDPKNQAQNPLVFSLSDGHTSIIGGAMSGKSTLLTTILYSLATTYSPEVVTFYCLDYSSKMLMALKGFPHTGDVLCDGDELKVSRFFNMLKKLVNDRKKLFVGGNFAQYLRANGMRLPAIIIAIDNFASFNEKTKEKYMPQLIELSKEGIANGIFLILTGAAYNMNEIPGRIAANIGKGYCLALNDKFAYGDILHTLKVDVLPETSFKGRGLTYVGKSVLEYQAALALKADDDYERIEQIKAKAAIIDSRWIGERPLSVPEIPDEPTWDVFKENLSVKALLKSENLLPIGYRALSADIYSFDLFENYCYMITGLPHAGKLSLLRLMIYSALEKEKVDIVIIDNGKHFTDIPDEKIRRICTEEELYDYCLNELTPTFKGRNQKKKELIREGFEGHEYYKQMQEFVPLYIFITSMSWFIKTIYADEHGMSGFMETLIKKGEGHKISFIGVMNLSERSAVGGYEVWNEFSAYGHGIHLGGNCAQNPFMSFSYMSNVEQAQNLSPGVGLLPDSLAGIDKDRIIIPLAKRQKRENLRSSSDDLS